MKWRKPSAELIRLFEELTPGPPATARKMFGFPAAFVNGNMFMGLHQDDMILRLGEEFRAELLKIADARVFEPMAGRPMREYVVLPPSLLKNRREVEVWVRRALDYGLSLPPKGSTTSAKRARAARKPATGRKTKQ
jgi:TfoX/Sxy family transcriptional regulator of competence genes